MEDERERRLRAAAGGGQVLATEFHLKAPMPGLVIAIPVEEGTEVTKGDVLVILESMKMQNELKSPQDGVVSRVRVAPGDSVDPKQIILTVFSESPILVPNTTTVFTTTWTMKLVHSLFFYF